MKNRKSKIMLIASIILIMLVSVLPIKSLAVNSKMLLVKENDNAYLIYVEELLNKSFEFAFSNNESAENLNYITSAKDSEGNNIAYVDEELKQNFFNSENTYIWVRTEEKVIINGEKISLENVKTIEQLKTIENITKSITVKANAEDEKIQINGKQGEKYYYQVLVPSSLENYNKLIALINEINNFDNSTNAFEKLQSYSELYDLYNSLITGLQEDKWLEAKGMEITKPYDAKEGEQYVLWLKDSKGNIDVQFLTAYEKEIKAVDYRKKTEEVVTTLPVTYDDMTALFVTLGIVGLAMLVIIVYKVKNKKDRI